MSAHRVTPPQLDQLTAYCEQLRLTRVAATLPTLLEAAAQREVSYRDFLLTVLGAEVASTQERHLAMRVQMARFPFQKTLEGFDWKAQPSIDPKVVRELATTRFVADGANALLLGPPGVGKTHLAVALGLEACRLGLRVAFTTAAALITTLGKALYENRLEERLKLLTQPKLLIIDEIGYIPIDRQGANLFFQLVSRRYARCTSAGPSCSPATRAWARGARSSATGGLGDAHILEPLTDDPTGARLSLDGLRAMATLLRHLQTTQAPHRPGGPDAVPDSPAPRVRPTPAAPVGDLADARPGDPCRRPRAAQSHGARPRPAADVARRGGRP